MTWLEVELFQKKFLDFKLEDKVVVKGKWVVSEQDGQQVELPEEAGPRPFQIYHMFLGLFYSAIIYFILVYLEIYFG